MSQFLEILEKNGIEPNFYCSEEFFNKAGFREVEWGSGMVGIEEEGQLIFPPILPSGEMPDPSPVVEEIWSDFADFSGYPGWSRELLDLEYIYDPRQFLEMKGGQWATFRKNVRKFPKRHGKELIYTSYQSGNLWIHPKLLWEGVCDIAEKWSKVHPEVYSPNIIFEYLVHGKNRDVLIDDAKRILGINVWDENYKYINFRFSFHDPSYDFLSEYLRYRFYTSPPIINSGKLVNDGGILGNPNLKNFKDKMNPVRVREVRSWKKYE